MARGIGRDEGKGALQHRDLALFDATHLGVYDAIDSHGHDSRVHMFDRSEVDGEPVLGLADGARLSPSTSFDGMTEEEFRNQLAAAGYGEPSTTAYGPNADGEFHTHDFCK